MAKFHGAAERDGLLAGFRSRGPATLWQCLEPGTLWQPVLQVTVMANTDGGPRVLTGTRRADTNPTHPNVISTPTSMPPLSFARCYVASVADSAVETAPIQFTELRTDDLRTMARFPETAARTRYPTRPPNSPTWWGPARPQARRGQRHGIRFPGEAPGHLPVLDDRSRLQLRRGPSHDRPGIPRTALRAAADVRRGAATHGPHRHPRAHRLLQGPVLDRTRRLRRRRPHQAHRKLPPEVP